MKKKTYFEENYFELADFIKEENEIKSINVNDDIEDFDYATENIDLVSDEVEEIKKEFVKKIYYNEYGEKVNEYQYFKQVSNENDIYNIQLKEKDIQNEEIYIIEPFSSNNHLFRWCNYIPTTEYEYIDEGKPVIKSLFADNITSSSVAEKYVYTLTALNQHITKSGLITHFENSLKGLLFRSDIIKIIDSVDLNNLNKYYLTVCKRNLFFNNELLYDRIISENKTYNDKEVLNAISDFKQQINLIYINKMKNVINTNIVSSYIEKFPVFTVEDIILYSNGDLSKQTIYNILKQLNITVPKINKKQMNYDKIKTAVDTIIQHQDYLIKEISIELLMNRCNFKKSIIYNFLKENEDYSTKISVFNSSENERMKYNLSKNEIISIDRSNKLNDLKKVSKKHNMKEVNENEWTIADDIDIFKEYNSKSLDFLDEDDNLFEPLKKVLTWKEMEEIDEKEIEEWNEEDDLFFSQLKK